jgi:hypothetical protein
MRLTVASRHVTSSTTTCPCLVSVHTISKSKWVHLNGSVEEGLIQATPLHDSEWLELSPDCLAGMPVWCQVLSRYLRSMNVSNRCSRVLAGMRGAWIRRCGSFQSVMNMVLSCMAGWETVGPCCSGRNKQEVCAHKAKFWALGQRILDTHELGHTPLPGLIVGSDDEVLLGDSNRFALDCWIAHLLNLHLRGIPGATCG